jgi:hypothetical protein
VFLEITLITELVADLTRKNLLGALVFVNVSFITIDPFRARSTRHLPVFLYNMLRNLIDREPFLERQTKGAGFMMRAYKNMMVHFHGLAVKSTYTFHCSV